MSVHKLACKLHLYKSKRKPELHREHRLSEEAPRKEDHSPVLQAPHLSVLYERMFL